MGIKLQTTFPQTLDTLLSAQTLEVGGPMTIRAVSSGGTARDLFTPANSGYCTANSGSGLLTAAVAFDGTDYYFDSTWIPRGASFYATVLHWVSNGNFYQVVLNRYSGSVYVEKLTAWGSSILGTPLSFTLFNSVAYRLLCEVSVVGGSLTIDVTVEFVDGGSGSTVQYFINDAIDASPHTGTFEIGWVMDGSELTYVEAGDIAAAGPTITDQPDNITANDGAPASFTVAATGAGTLTYQWRRNGTNVTNGGAYSGATAATLNISATTLAMNGDDFDCVVTDTAGSVTSALATLTVTPPPLTVSTEIIDNDGNPRASYTFDKVYAIRISDNTIVHTFTGVSTNGSGILTLSHASLTAVPHVFTTVETTGTPDTAGAFIATPA